MDRREFIVLLGVAGLASLWGAGDPVGTGLVVNISHPGSNITGVTELSTELTAKRLQLFKDTVPSLRRVAVIWNDEDQSMSLRFREAEAAAPRLSLSIMPLPIHEVDDFDAVFTALTRNPPDGVFVVSDRITAQREPELIGFLLAVLSRISNDAVMRLWGSRRLAFHRAAHGNGLPRDLQSPARASGSIGFQAHGGCVLRGNDPCIRPQHGVTMPAR